MQKSTSQNDTLSFRVKPNGPMIPITSLQKRKLVRFLSNHPNGVLVRQILEKTNIEQVSARIAELRKMGLLIDAMPQPSPKKRDPRKLFRLSDDIELVEGGSHGKG